MTHYDERQDNDCEECDQMLNERTEFMSSNFTLEDFLAFDKTRDFLTQNYLWQFEKTCGVVLDKFYENEVNYCRQDMSTLFKNETNHINIGLFKSIVFKYVEPIYDHDMIYCDASLCRSFVEQHEEQARKKKYERRMLLNNNKDGPIAKKFDWGDKRIN